MGSFLGLGFIALYAEMAFSKSPLRNNFLAQLIGYDIIFIYNDKIFFLLKLIN